MITSNSGHRIFDQSSIATLIHACIVMARCLSRTIFQLSSLVSKSRQMFKIKLRWHLTGASVDELSEKMTVIHPLAWRITPYTSSVGQRKSLFAFYSKKETFIPRKKLILPKGSWEKSTGHWDSYKQTKNFYNGNNKNQVYKLKRNLFFR